MISTRACDHLYWRCQNIKKEINTILKEMYKSPDLDWIDSFVDELYDNKNINSKYIENKYNIFILFEKATPFEIIVSASYNYKLKLFIITFNEDLDYWVEKNINREDVKTDLLQYIVHKQQDQSIHSFDNITGVSELDKSKHQEIDAYARDIAFQIENQFGISGNDVIREIIKYSRNELNKINNLNKICLDNIKYYYSKGGSIWKRFLAEVWRYFYES